MQYSTCAYGLLDGIHWHFKNQLQVIIQGKQYSIVGNICMGVFAINLGIRIGFKL